MRRRAGLLLAGAVWAGTPSVTSADESPRSQAQCEHAAEPGRVRCDVELRPAHGAVRWADVQVVGAPAFVAPLRGRIGPHEATAHEESLWRWGFGLVARGRGEGELSLRVRAVICEEGRCRSEIVSATAKVSVGP